jgi:spore coat protein CotH
MALVTAAGLLGLWGGGVLPASGTEGASAAPIERGGERLARTPPAAEAPAAPETPTPEAPGPRTDFYDLGQLRTISIQFATDDWEPQLERLYRTGQELPATVVIDGEKFEAVGVRFRGNSSYRRVQTGSKRPLRLKLDASYPQDVGGYRTLNLLNGMNDPTFVRPVLYSVISGQYMPTARANFARVEINGEDWGVYVNLQQFDKEFLGDFFGTTQGARWKAPGSPRGRAGLEYLGEDPEPYRRIYEIKTRDDPARWADLIELTRVLNQTPLEELERALEPVLDIDGALRFLALEMVLVNSDGYWSRASDYNLYQDPDGRFHIIPHDINEALGVSGNVRLDPLTGLSDAGKPLRSRLLAVPELRERYLAYVNEIAERWLDWDTLAPMVQQYQALIGPHVRQDARKLYPTEAFDAGVGILRGFVTNRRAFLLQ